MKILYLTINNENRISSHIFTSLVNELKIDPTIEIDFIKRTV